MSFESAQTGWTGSSRNLKDLASVMWSKGGGACRNETPPNIVETPHLRINLPKEHMASLETMPFDDIQSAYRNGGVDRYEAGDGQIAYKSGVGFADIGRGVGVFDMKEPQQDAMARILRAREDALGFETTHIALNGLLTVLGTTQHLGRRH